jgi:hypothetical protein
MPHRCSLPQSHPAPPLPLILHRENFSEIAATTAPDSFVEPLYHSSRSQDSTQASGRNSYQEQSPPNRRRFAAQTPRWPADSLTC